MYMILCLYLFNPVEKDEGIGVANGKEKLGLVGKMLPVPFSPNQLLRLIVVGSMLSLTCIGVLVVCCLLRVLVRPYSRFFLSYYLP